MSNPPLTPLQWAGIILLLPFLLLLTTFWFFWSVVGTVVLHASLLALWAPRGRRVLFVYSNSPNWMEYCETEIVPKLPKTAAVLNWSDRKTWRRWTLAPHLFRVYGGREEFNPLGIVFRPFKPIRVFRFWQPFRDAKHGKPHHLERVKSEFLAAARRQG